MKTKVGHHCAEGGRRKQLGQTLEDKSTGMERATLRRRMLTCASQVIPLPALLFATVAALPLLTASATFGQTVGSISFNIPPGDLGSVLVQIGRAASQPISFPANLTQGRSAGPIVGRMTAPEALVRALAGSGLVVVPAAGGGLTIRRGASAVLEAAPGDLEAIDVADAGTRDQGFKAVDSQSSARIDIPLQENPRSVIGVTDDVIRSQSQISVLDTARNVSNVRINEGSGQAQGSPSYEIRGFSQNQILINGQPSGSAGLPITDIERIDVIKGPTTEFSGPTFGGGAINAITKAPTSTPIRRADVFYGSRFYRTLAFDFGGPISDLEGVTYRLNLSGNTANYAFGGNSSPHEALISPVVSWQGRDTRVTAGLRYTDTISGIPPFTFGTPENGFRPFRIRRDVAFGNLDSMASFRSLNPYGEIQHHIGSLESEMLGNFDFSFQNRSSYFITSSAVQGYIPGSTVVGYAGTEPLVRPVGNVSTDNRRRVITQSDLLVKHNTEYFRQTMRFGIDYLSVKSKNKSNLLYRDDVFSLINPRQDLAFPNFFSESYFGGNFFAYGKQNIENTGISFQDKIDLFERLHILGSVRQDWYNSRTTGTFPANIEQSALTYTAGAVYDLLPWASVYGSVGTGFAPQDALINRTQPAPPQISDLNEIGFKLRLLNDNLVVTGAKYSNAYSNQVIFDPITRSNRLGPGYRADGYEIDFQGQVTPNVQVIGGYGYNDFSNFPDPFAAPGTPPNIVPGQPKHQANIFAVYTFTNGTLKGLSIGGGGRGQTFSYTDFQPKNTAPKLPGFITYDAVIGYTMENFRVDVNIRNIFDKYYYSTTVNPFFIPLAQGRTFMMRASLDF